MPSSPAAAPIRRFSRVLWVVVVLVVGAGITAQLFNRFEYGPAGEYESPPWYQDDPVMATVADDGLTWSARAGAGMRLSDEVQANGAVLVTLLNQIPRAAMIGYTGPGKSPAHETVSYGSIYYNDYDDQAESTIVFVEPGGTLWVNGSGQWQVRVEPLDYTEIVESFQGSGSIMLRYSGFYGSAVLSNDGDLVGVDVYTPGHGHDYVSISFVESREHFSWQPGEAVFRVSAQPGVNWSLRVYDLDELSGARSKEANSAEGDGIEQEPGGE